MSTETNLRIVLTLLLGSFTASSHNGAEAWSGQCTRPNTGNTDGPLASLAGAQDAIREWKAQAADTEPIRVIVAYGVYTLIVPLMFTPEDNGREA